MLRSSSQNPVPRTQFPEPSSQNPIPRTQGLTAKSAVFVPGLLFAPPNRLGILRGCFLYQEIVLTEEHQRPRDLTFRIIIGLVVVVTLWILATPFVPAVGMVSMKRFHLRTDSFTGWAALQIVPSMYNFGNTVEIFDRPASQRNPVFVSERPRYMNHFPARRLTFADGRYHVLSPGQDRWLTINSTYRGQALKTQWHVAPIGAGAFELKRLDDEAAQ